MTDKEQRIINGVDVSKCDFSLDCLGIICQLKNGRTDKCNCSDYPNCYFKQLARKTQEYQNLADILRDTDTYSEVCSACKDDILIYPSISGRTSYTDNEVDAITLKRIIDTLKNKTQECEELKDYAKRQENQRETYYKEFLKKDKALEEIGKIVKINCEEICGRKFEDCNDFLCTSKNILDIINKAKGEQNVTF